MKMLKRILAAVAASAVSLCIFTACGSDPKYDTSIFINTVRAKTGYNVKESKSLDNAFQAGLDALSSDKKYAKGDNPGYEQIAYDSIKKALGDPDQTKYRYIKSAILGSNLAALKIDESPVAAYTFYSAPIQDFGGKTYKDLNSAQLYAASTTFRNNQHKLFSPEYNTKQPNNSSTQTASYVPEEISVMVKTITVNGKKAPYVFVLLKGTMSIDSSIDS